MQRSRLLGWQEPGARHQAVMQGKDGKRGTIRNALPSSLVKDDKSGSDCRPVESPWAGQEGTVRHGRTLALGPGNAEVSAASSP
jgi:hypothetical protein